MSQSVKNSGLYFHNGTTLAQLVEVLEVDEDLSRPVLDNTPIGVGSQKGAYGVFGLTIAAKIAFDKANHLAIEQQLAEGGVVRQVKFVRHSGSECIGDARCESFRIRAAAGQFLVADVVLKSDGAWTVDGVATG